MKTHLMILWLVVCGLLMIGGVIPAEAQISDYSPIFIAPYYITNARWSDDSRLFTFQEVALIPSKDNPYIYTETEQGFYTTTETWHGYPVVPGQSVRSDTQLLLSNQWLLASQIGKPANNLRRATYKNGQISFIFISPDKRFAVYPSPEPDSGGFPLSITNLETGQTIVADGASGIYIPFLVDFSLGYHVIWSGDSTAFTIETTSAYAAAPVHYVTGYADDLNNITFTEVDQGVPLENPEIFFGQPWALSHDGKRVLVGVWYDAGLAIWDTEKPLKDSLTIIKPVVADVDQYPTLWVQGATFTPG
ncbi:MAG TPA: hypothetical protein VHL11_08400 [Phototrophicaceae bacterium]|jgi:hypothetical protein|nr:hypothetical protein [Phototrophicaceae bacterium]